MTPAQVAANHKALTNLAELLSAWGLGDAHNRAEHIARRLIADGYAVIEPVPPLRQPAELDGAGYREFVEAKEAFANRQKEHH